MIDRPMPPAAAGVVESGKCCYTFQDRGFPGAVFADDDGDGAIEAQFKIAVQEGKAKRIGLAVRDARGIEPDPLQVRRRQIDVAISSGHGANPHAEKAFVKLFIVQLYHRLKRVAIASHTLAMT